MKKVFLFFLFPITLFASAQKPSFNHIAVYVQDLQKSSDFYKNLIGLDTIANPFNDGRHVWFSIGDHLQLHLIAGAQTVRMHEQDNHFCFSVPSVESFIKRLSNQGINYYNSQGKLNTITLRPDGVKQIYFKDPDGNWIEINDAYHQ
jgi:lactoylglutathione lyase